MAVCIKKALSVALIFVIVFSMSVQGSGVLVYADSELIITTKADVDEDEGIVTFTFSVENNPGILDFYIKPDYDKKVLTYKGYKAHDFFGSSEEFAMDSGAPEQYIDLYESDRYAAFTKNEEILSITFYINSDASAGKYSLKLYTSSGKSICYGEDWFEYQLPDEIEFEIGDVQSSIPISKITINSLPSQLKMNDEGVELTATIEPDEPTNPNIVWSLETIERDGKPYDGGYTNSVAYITEDLFLKPANMHTGRVRVTARAADGQGAKDSIEINVVKSVTSFGFTRALTLDRALAPGEKFPTAVYFIPADAVDQEVEYRSEDESVATIDEYGVIDALAAGHTYVWATSHDGGYMSSMPVYVLDPATGPAASVDGQAYDTLDEAAAAAVYGDTITLLKDQSYPDILKMPDGCSLDLGGYTLHIKQIRIDVDVTVPYIGNGTLVAIPIFGDYDLNISSEAGTILMRSGARLEYLEDMALFSAAGTDLIRLFSTEKPIMLDEINNCEITARSVVISNYYTGVIMRVNNVKATGSLLYWAIGGLPEINIYGGEYDMKAASFAQNTGVVNIYGGSFRERPSSYILAAGYKIEEYAGDDGLWYKVVKGSASAVLNISVEPANAALTLRDTDTGEFVAPSSVQGNKYAFDLWMDREYEYSVSADGYVTKTGHIPISFVESDMTIALVKVSGADEGAKDASVKGGDFITAGGSYHIEKGDPNVSYGVITVATREPVKLIGLGISDTDALFSDLTIDCASGADITVENLWINNNRGQGTGSGPTNMGVNIINFKGGGNVLRVSGENLLENQEYVQGAGIHVPPGAELTLAGDGVMYFYKYSQGCGIGGNAYEPCGDITFRSGRYFIKGSKTGAVIGGDAAGSSAQNGDITVSGGEIVIVSVATGDAIGESNQANCGGDVYLRGGNLTTISCWSGLGIGRGNLYITGGSYKPVLTANAISGMPNSNTHYVREDAVWASKYDGTQFGGYVVYSNGKPARLFTFDTGLLSRSAGSFSVSGATNYSGGLHDYVYTGATSTVASFRRAATDKNLYFYLPTEKDQTLTVNGETFTVSWDAEKAEFAVTKGGGSGQTDAPTVVKVDPLEVETAVDDGKAVGTVDAAEVKELLEEAVKKIEEAIAGGDKNVVAEIDLDMRTGGSEDVKAAELTVKADGLALLAERGDVVVTVQSDIWDITFDNATLKGLAAESKGKDLIIIQETLDAAALDGPQREAAGDNPVVSLSVSLGDSRVSEFNGAVTVKAPYSPPAGMAAADYDLLTVYRLDAGGGIVEMDTASYDAKTGIMSFETGGPSTFFVSEWLSPFDDARRGDWYYKAMRFVYSEGLMTGVTDDEFAPNTNLSRAMLVTVLYRYEGEPETAGGTGFTDATDGMWYSDAVAWAVGNGIVKGYGDGLFGTNESITREELATILYRYSEQTDDGAGGLDGYDDGELTSDWATDALRWAVDEGVMQGKSETAIDPLGTATRAETATMLMRYANAFPAQ